MSKQPSRMEALAVLRHEHKYHVTLASVSQMEGDARDADKHRAAADALAKTIRILEGEDSPS